MSRNKNQIFESIVSFPSVVLAKGTHQSKKALRVLEQSLLLRRTGIFWKKLGPGLITGAADDDPAGIATYSQAGAAYGFGFLWMAIITFPFMSLVQEMCARIALVTNRGLAHNIRDKFKAKWLYGIVSLLFIANTLNIGADLGAMAAAFNLIFPTANTSVVLVVIGLLILLLEIYLPYQAYAKYLKWITLILFTYVISFFLVGIPIQDLLASIVSPGLSFSSDVFFLITAILGTTISPYLFFWQTSQEIEEKILTHTNHPKTPTKEVSPREIKRMRTDVWSGMLLSNGVMFCIIAVCGVVLHANGITNITSASDAANALRPLAGESAFFLFALGIIGTGFLAVPILAGSTSYAFAESFGWKEGLYRTLNQAKSFYGIIIISILVGLAINFLNINPIKALFYSAVVNGLIAPFIIWFIVSLSSDTKVMGKHSNSRRRKWFGYLLVFLMSSAGIATIISFFIS